MNTFALKADEEYQVILDKPIRQFNNICFNLLFLLLIVILLVWAGITLMKPDILPIRYVRIEGEFRQLSPDALQAIVTDTVRGGFFNVNVDVIQNILLQDPWVQLVTVRRNWPDSLTVQVTEQIAVAKWGEQGLINLNSEFFSPESATYPEGLPILLGPEKSYDLMLKKYQLYKEILTNANLAISGLTLNERRAWSVQLLNGPLLVLGRKNILDRMERFTAYVNSSLTDDLSDIEIVDLRYTNGFAVRWKYNSNNSELGQDYHG